MADMMTFPDNFINFIKDYSFKDKEEIYTNGSDLISTFRVFQGWEHYIGLFKKAYKESNDDLHMLGHYTKKILKDMGEI